MNIQILNCLSFRRWLVLSSVLLALVFSGFYYFQVSAQTEKTEETTAQILVNGKIAFSRRLAGPTAPEGRIIIANPDGSGQVGRAANAEDLTQPAWSPDGTKIVATSRQQNQDLYIINADGSGSVNLTNTGFSITETNPSWSATGKIAYEKTNSSGGDAQIWVINADGTGNAQFSGITQSLPSAPMWSPDGNKLAFVSGGEIWVINADGTNERRVTTNSTIDNSPDWSPDGTKIVFTSGNSVSVINADGTNEALLANNGSTPSWSPDGTKIAFSRSGVGNGVITMDANGTNQVVIAVNTTQFPLCCDVIYENPSWQPFAQAPNTFTISGRVTYNNLPVPDATVTLTGALNGNVTTDSVGNYQFSGLTAGGNYTVTPSVPNYVFVPASRNFNNLLSNQTGNFEVQGVCTSPNRCVRNGKVAFVYNGDIHTINPDGTNQVNITNNPASDREPSFSPFGTNIIFSTDRDGNNEIYRMNTDGSNPVRLTNNAGFDSSPSYSPDGNFIIFRSTRDGNSEIYKMNSDGTNPVRLTNDPGSDTFPAFSTDGQKIIFVSNREGKQKIFSMNADGTNQQRLAEVTGIIPGFESLAYAPDGSKITFSYSPDPSTTHPSNWTVNPDGTNLTQVGGGTFLIYSPDATKRAYVCCYFEPNLNPARIRVTGINGGPEQTLSQSPLNFDRTSFAWQPLPLTNHTPFDYDGDGKADVSVFRASENRWYILRSSDGQVSEPFFAAPGDVPVPADFDGDGKTDIAVWRPSSGDWWYLSSANGAQINVRWGMTGDLPRPSDFDGDGKTDFVVYRPSTGIWYRFGSAGQTSNIAFGLSEDKPLIGDFDGDGKADAAVFRPSSGDWWYAASAAGGEHRVVHWGATGDIPVPADFDGDGKTDFTIYRPSTGSWYILFTGSSSYTSFTFGLAGDKPVAADYDGDGKADAAVFRPSTGVWYLLQTTSGFGALQWGIASDIPSQNAFLP